MRLKPYSYIEISVETRSPESFQLRSVLCDMLEASGISSSALAFFEFRDSLRIAAYTRSFGILKKVESAMKRLRPKGFRLKSKVLAREDWLEKWQLEYHIMPLGRRFTLVPLWQKEKFRKGKEPIYLDPKGAFGSGTHPTTQLMIKLMEPLEGRFSSFLDLGTGTGILSVAARKLGAETIYAVDKDPGSVRAARFNLKTNRVKVDYLKTGDIMTMKCSRKFETVGVNVISAVLINAKKKILRWVGKSGYLIVSGIHLQNLGEVRRELAHPDFRCLKVIKKKGWAGILYKRKGK